MSETSDDGRRLYKALGPDGEVAWVDHDELWRLQQSQAEELRQGQVRRRRLLLLVLAGLVVVALVGVGLWWRSASQTPPAPTVVAAPARPPEAEARRPDELRAAAGPEQPAGEADADLGPSPSDRVDAAVRTWAGAWARQDVSAYLGAYAAQFEPAGELSRPGWQSLRRRRLLAPASIQVEIEQLEIALRGVGRAEASFVQRYRSPSYSDVVRKSLDLVEQEGEWRIVAERAAALAATG